MMRLRLRPSRLPLLYLYAAGLTLALPPTAVQADVLHSAKGYSVTIPHGWQTTHDAKTYSDGWPTDRIYSHPPGAFPLFRVEVDPQGRATMKDAEAMQARFVQQTVPGFRVLQQRMRSVSGSSASETAAVGTFQGRPMLLDMIYTIHAGRGYTLTLMTPPTAMKTNLKTFANILNTLRWVH